MKYLETLKKYWGYDNFRGIQRDIIESIGSGNDTLGLMPTGGGKSITFQVPAMTMDGICIVVTPLIALMKDQVDGLRRHGIKASCIHAGMTQNQISITYDNCIYGGYKFLYISPERLASDLFRAKLTMMKVSMITVDESHCISQWGYDFRPAYLNISNIRQILPGVPVLALTATATPEVVVDICEKLEFGNKPKIFRMSFERKNLAYVVRHTDNKENEAVHILSCVNGSSIIYTRNRKGTREIAQMLEQNGISATFYHAGLDNDTKDERQKAWQEDKVRVMVATNAFGMGIDKPDVRVVIHIDMPDSPEAYFQEAGRAGRDGEKAYAVLLYSPSDKSSAERRIDSTFPPKDYIKEVYEHVCYYTQMAMGDGMGCTRAFNLEEFCYNFHHFPNRAKSALHILTRAGYIDYTDEEENASRLMFNITRDDLYWMRNRSESEEKLIKVVLRSYTGLFTDFSYIDEKLLAKRSGLTQTEVYQCLLNLSRRHVISYIPFKKSSFICFTVPRCETKHLRFSPTVYEERKQSYKKRIFSMVEYAESDNKCRSRMLLRYFGEKSTSNCGQCDTCLSGKACEPSQEEFEYISKEILRLINEEGTDIDSVADFFPEQREKAIEILRYLMSEEKITR